MHNVISHPYQFDQSISVLVVLISIQILLERSVSKEWRTWSDAAFCGVWSGSTLFAYVPQKGRLTYMG